MSLVNVTVPAKPSHFNFMGHPVRVVPRYEEPWFVAADICAALGIIKAHQAVEPLDRDEKGRCLTSTLGGPQELLIVSESGMYAIALRSRKAMEPGTAAHAFRKWVTAEVLPTIRKTGGYGNGLAGKALTPERLAEMYYSLSAKMQKGKFSGEERERMRRVASNLAGHDFPMPLVGDETAESQAQTHIQQ